MEKSLRKRLLSQGADVFSILTQNLSMITEQFILYLIADYCNELQCIKKTKLNIRNEAIQSCCVFQNKLYLGPYPGYDFRYLVHLNLNTPEKVFGLADGSVRRVNHIVRNESYTIICDGDEKCVHVRKNGQECINSIEGFLHPTHCYIYEGRLYVVDSLGTHSKVFVVDIESSSILFSFGETDTLEYQGIVVENDIIYLLSSYDHPKWDWCTVEHLHTFTLNGRITKTVKISKHVSGPLESNDYNFHLFQNKLVIMPGGYNEVSFFGLNLEFLCSREIKPCIYKATSDNEFIHVMDDKNKLYTFY